MVEGFAGQKSDRSSGTFAPLFVGAIRMYLLLRQSDCEFIFVLRNCGGPKFDRRKMVKRLRLAKGNRGHRLLLTGVQDAKACC